jgi:hypothetical protein
LQVNPHDVPSQVVWALVTVGHGLHLVGPQLALLELLAQAPLQTCSVAKHTKHDGWSARQPLAQGV